MTFLLIYLMSWQVQTPSEGLDRIMFGSCHHQDRPTPIFETINRHHPDLFILLGDNIYGDTQNMKLLAAKYKKLGDRPAFAKLQQQTKVVAIWDDHDFGENDAGSEYPQKEGSRKILLDFFKEPSDSERRTRPDGIYTSYMLEAPNQRKVQVILPDLRWNRDPLGRVSRNENQRDRLPKQMGPYRPSNDAQASMLGEAQWTWLEAELKRPADLKIIGSSLQLLADFTGWESWANYPADRNRLLTLIKEHRINGVIIISGDTHWGEISRFEEGMDYPLWEVTSSGLTEEWKAVSPNRHRVGKFTDEVNYGEIAMDWNQKDPEIQFGLRDLKGNIVMQERFRLSSISPYSKKTGE